jgi:hypothetical protein
VHEKPTLGAPPIELKFRGGCTADLLAMAVPLDHDGANFGVLLTVDPRDGDFGGRSTTYCGMRTPWMAWIAQPLG